MRVKTALPVLLSLCLLGTAGTAQAAVASTIGIPANLDWQAARPKGLDIGNVAAATAVFGNNGTGFRFDDPSANQHYFSDISQESAVLTGTALAADVPELATWAMMLGGFGAIGMGLRMRRRKANAPSLSAWVRYSPKSEFKQALSV